MTIKSQLRILIFVVVIIPLTAIILIPVYHYLTSPARYLIKGYQEVKALSNLDLSQTEWDEIHNAILNIPREIEVLIYYDGTIITSNFPNIKAGDKLSKEKLFDYIQTTSAEFDYRIHKDLSIDKNTPSSKIKKNMNSEDKSILIVCRSPLSEEEKNKTKFILPFLLLLLSFEAGIIVIIWRISRAVSSSISYIEKNTRLIADGKLDTEISESKVLKRKNYSEISSLIESLEKMRTSLKDNEERRTKFIMGVSHDLRTPVAIIKGYTEAITDGVAGDMDSDSVKKSLEIIHTKSEALEDMINNLIDYVKLDSSEWVQSLESIKLKPVLTEIASSCYSMGELYKREIIADINIEDSVEIPLDKTLFERAIQNLFSNAIRYTKDGDKIEVKASQNKENIKISVADSGCGISKKDLEHIFSLFYRASPSRREAGYGIGLSVVKTIINAMNWNIDVKSEVGKGSCFTITIPLNVNKTE